jgi:hypothetical protein
MRVLPVILAGCVGATVTDEGKTSTAPDTGACDAASAPIGWDDATALGTPRELANGLVFVEDTTFTYADGTTTDLHLAVTLDEAAAPTGRTLLGGDADCTVAREVTVPLRLAFETADGAFLEDAAVEGVATDAGAAIRGQPYLPADRHLGSHDVTGWDEVNLAVGRWGAPSAGEVVLIADRRVECGVGAWGGPLLTACATP